jgi:hypothetical protein
METGHGELIFSNAVNAMASRFILYVNLLELIMSWRQKESYVLKDLHHSTERERENDDDHFCCPSSFLFLMLEVFFLLLQLLMMPPRNVNSILPFCCC